MEASKMKEKSIKNLWRVHIDGSIYVIKATQSQMEYQYKHNPTWGDYTAITALIMPKEAPQI